MFKYKYKIFSEDWIGFAQQVKGVTSLNESNGINSIKLNLDVLATFCNESNTISTNIPKLDFFKILRGVQKIDINKLVSETQSELKHVILIENELGTDIPTLVINTKKEAEKVAKVYSENYKTKVISHRELMQYYDKNIMFESNALKLRSQLILVEKIGRFIPKKYTSKDKIVAYKNGVKIGYFQPDGFSVFDTHRNEFVIVTRPIGNDNPKDNQFQYDSWKSKSVVQEICTTFNTVGATCGNDNLEIIKRF